jgi:hypothetical protein
MRSQSGYQVTTSVRSEDKAQQLLDLHPAWTNMVEFVSVPELRKSDAFVKVFDRTYDFIIHTASPVAFKVDDVQKDLIDPALQGLAQFLVRLSLPSNTLFLLLGLLSSSKPRRNLEARD